MLEFLATEYNVNAERTKNTTAGINPTVNLGSLYRILLACPMILVNEMGNEEEPLQESRSRISSNRSPDCNANAARTIDIKVGKQPLCHFLQIFLIEPYELFASMPLPDAM